MKLELKVMRDISNKIITLRSAKAQAVLFCQIDTLGKIKDKKIPKGDVFEFARAAGYLGAKNTANFIPHCHPIGIDSLNINFEFIGNSLSIRACIARCNTLPSAACFLKYTFVALFPVIAVPLKISAIFLTSFLESINSIVFLFLFKGANARTLSVFRDFVFCCILKRLPE